MIIKIHFFYLYIFILIFIPINAYTGPTTSISISGTNGEDAAESLLQVYDFVKAACAVACDFHGQKLKYLNGDQIKTMQLENNFIGFAGRSADYDLTKQDDIKEMENTRNQILSILSQLDHTKDILVGGATDTGFNKILSRLGSQAGFQVLGLHPWKALNILQCQ